jgi:DNA polymerase
MAWTERQHAVLRGLGLRVWTPPSSAATAAAAAAAAPADGMPIDAAATDHGPAAAVPRPSATPPMAVSALAVSARAAAPVSMTSTPPAQPVPAAAAAPTLLADERSAQIATLDWPALRNAVADCRACGLCSSRKQTVFGMGATRAHWLVVGEAPGEQEDRQGLPFVGPSGELLDAMLRALQLTRADDGPAGDAQRVYIANTIKCRPPGNRNPAADELARCEPFLVRQIALLRPRIILAMGRFAVQSLLRSSDPVGRLRGRVHQYQGVPLVVTYHPAYLLRNPADKARAWDDLCLAAATAERSG